MGGDDRKGADRRPADLRADRAVDPSGKTGVCSVHNKRRTMSKLTDDGNGGFKCIEANQCATGPAGSSSSAARPRSNTEKVEPKQAEAKSLLRPKTADGSEAASPEARKPVA